jgi:hypothetical protein
MALPPPPAASLNVYVPPGYNDERVSKACFKGVRYYEGRGGLDQAGRRTVQAP